MRVMKRGFATRRFREFIGDQFADGQHAQDVRRRGETEERQPGIFNMQPTETRRPADHGRRGQGAEPGDYANQERKQVGGHGNNDNIADRAYRA
jgi:hypothetical protein